MTATQLQKSFPIGLRTTFSGCSYALKGSQEVYDITKWPKYTGFYGKVPTLLYYKTTTNRLLDWGNGARLLSFKPKQEGNLIHSFKMWLADDQTTQHEENHSSIDIIADYLSKFHQHILEELEKKLDPQYTPDQYCYCLTVPAIWSDHAKAMMREAVIKAGMIQMDDPLDRLTLISEPEAAALYCEQKCDMSNLKHQDKFMIIDAGGGTVDLIIYEVQQSSHDKTRKLKELTSGYGGICGSSDIDKNMRKLLLKKFGEEGSSMPICTLEMIMETFIEYIKPVFHGDEDQYLDIPATALSYLPEGLLNEDYQLVLSAEELAQEVFKPVFDSVIMLIKNQLSTIKVNTAFLVGGFGSSIYLYQTIKKAFQDQIDDCVVPPHAELAIVRGAVYHCISPGLVTSKVARYTYGVRTRLPFEEGLDPEESAVFTSDGIKRCSTRFDIILRKGERIKVNSKIRRSFWVSYPKHTEADLYIYNGDDPIPRQINDVGIKKIADFPIKMPYLPGMMTGERIDVNIDFIFGLTELKVDVLVSGYRSQFTTRILDK
ncbi:uncharacterized protein BX664DRAFT_369526 [Halteromyces radiatus]|uniref:uncharacterized protein n=1 Tax=Halteromyces radiatus TaxID=101107 RepID=UPI00221EF54C|nr:uncharacterized protein BX664DRAFT_369526 [Halteromyces radiatus]KAI8077866.1 hypothetical protein BX664DRAFT_369526 [Halteromyces radiatus]